MSKKIFFKGVSYGYIKQIVAMIIGVLSMPLLLDYLGPTKYGIWVLILGLTGYINTISFGIPSAMSTLVAKALTYKEKYLILMKSFFVLFYLSLFFLVMFIVVFNFNDDWVVSLLGNINQEYMVVTKFMLFYFVLFTLLKLPFDLFIQFFTGMNAVYLTEIYATFKSVVGFISILLSVYLDLDLSIFIIIWLGSNLSVSLVSILHVYFKYRCLKADSSDEVNVNNKMLFKSGFSFFQVGLAASVVWSTDNLLISHFLSPDLVTPYSIAFKIFTYIFMFSAIVNGVVSPIYGNAYASNDYEKINKLTNLIFKFLPLVGACVWLFLILFSKEIIVLWTGSDDAFGGYLLFFSLGLYGYVLSYVNTYATLLYSLNLANKACSVVWLEAFINLTLSVILIQFMGISGVALGTAISALIISLILPRLLFKFTNNEVIYDKSYATKQVFALVAPSVLICYLIVDFVMFYKVVFFVLFVLIMLVFSWKSLSSSDKFLLQNFSKSK